MVHWVTNWLERHQHPASRGLHAVAIPMLIWALVAAIWQLTQWRWDLWWRPASLITASYLLQWIGHRIEGNDMGEAILIKKLMGRPYVTFSPRYAKGKGLPAK